MSFRPHHTLPLHNGGTTSLSLPRKNHNSVPPKGYVPGLGRGAAGFTTRSDVGPVAASTESADGDDGGSRAAAARRARYGAATANNNNSTTAESSVENHGPPQQYVAGVGRGAGRLGGAASRGEPSGGIVGTFGVYDPFLGYSERALPGTDTQGEYDDDHEDDDEADRIWAAVDERMNKKKRKHADTEQEPSQQQLPASARISVQFRELKERLKDLTEVQWASIPDVGDYSLKYKQSAKNRRDIFTPLTDSLLEQRSNLNRDATASTGAGLAATRTVPDSKNPVDTGFKSVVTNMSGLAAARGTVLGMSLDKAVSTNTEHSTVSSSIAGTATSVDPQGYLTSLSSVGANLAASQVSDIHKARLLLKSVRDTNPHHGPAWIASCRVEEAAGKTLQARKIIQQGCDACPDSEDVWLEAARLHPIEVAKSILATAVRRLPTSVKLFLKAADLEHHQSAKKAVLRKALEANPTSVTLWKAAIDLEDAQDARILLSVAVEKVPHSVELWLALARLETYQNAQKVLNKARKALPAERSIWIAAAKLEESQNHGSQVVDQIIHRAVKTLVKKKDFVVITRAQWLQEAEAAEAAGSTLTSAAIVKYTIGQDVEEEDRQRTWADDAKSALANGSVATARAILNYALDVFPLKRAIWMQSVELERKYGTATSLDKVLASASEKLPRVEIFWLLRAKERWLAGDIDTAREVLTCAFAANPDSEAVWLAAAKLEWETGEIERARVLLERARDRAPTARVFMKSAVFEREHKNYDQALALIEEGITRYKTFPKLFMMGGQINADDLQKDRVHLDKARTFYQRGIEACPNNVILWILASRLEERASTFLSNGDNGNSKAVQAGVGSTKARSLLELARLKNPKNPELWLEAVRLERRTGNAKLADTLLAKGLQECPSSGVLLAESIRIAPRVEQKSKSAHAIKRCPDDPNVIAAVASLFASERKTDKARKWFDRAVILNPDLGDSWARYYAFECSHNNNKGQQDQVKERCIAAEPKHGEIWSSVTKDMANHGNSLAEMLDLAAKIVETERGLYLWRLDSERLLIWGRKRQR